MKQIDQFELGNLMYKIKDSKDNGVIIVLTAENCQKIISAYLGIKENYEEMEKAIEILKDTKNIEVYFFDNGKRHYRIKFNRTREQEISKQKYELLKEILKK